ncbi:VaFE repeat-containing surface-anchored protein [Candidatus Saccharibacteria bacterium]|nr:VaFE repeat-containing surface-anchored protein [Candidatus Saccharibacteria bacterium]
MHLESGRFTQLKGFFQNRGKKFWIPIFVFAIAGLGFGIYSAVRAITSAGDATTITVANNYRGYTYDSNAIYYGAASSWQPWSTRWYNVNGNDAMCLQASKTTPTGSGTAAINTTNVKQIMLATVPSYSAASVAAGGPDYYSLFNAQYNWSSKTSAIRNLMTRDDDTNIVYSTSDPRARTNSSGEEIVKYTDYYYGCNSYYSTGCNKSLAGSLVDSRDAIFAIGHMAASGVYAGDYYALDANDKAVVQGVATDINQWFASNYPNAADEYESYTTWVDATHQTIGWLEYKGPSSPTRIRVCKKSTTGTMLQGAVFSFSFGTPTYYTTGSDGCTAWIEVDATSIYYTETTAPTGYVIYSNEQTCTVTTEHADNTCWAHDNEQVPTAYIKIKKVADANSGTTYAGLTVVGTVFSVKSGSTEVATITIGSDGTGTTNVSLPVGTYTITEKTATAGFNTNSTSMTVTLDSSNTASNPATVDMTGSPFRNDVIKGKISLTKTGYELAANGSASSRNLGGITFTAVNKADPSLTYTIGPTAADGSVTSPEMIYGTYTVTEVRSNANNAYDLISFEATVNGSSTYPQGTKNDTIPDQPSLTTIARNSNSTFENPDKELEIAQSVGVTDRITCSGLQNGAQYKLEGELYELASGTKLSPTGASTFTADGSGTCGNLDMVFSTFDTSPYIDKTLSIKQVLYKNNGTSSSPDWVRIFIHNANLADTNEQVKVKSIEVTTTATSTRAADNKKLAAGTVTINDNIHIVGLTNGQSYTIEGALKYGTTTVANTSASYTMSASTGTPIDTTLSFTNFDSTPYVGKDLTVVITLKNSAGATLVEHVASDNSETVSVLTPEIGTTAINGRDVSLNEHELEVGATTIQDTVTYKGLVSGDTYLIKGEVHKLNSDGTDSGTVVSTNTKSFTATGEDNLTGETITFNIDTIANCAVNNKLTLPCKFVVYEYIWFGNNSQHFASHEDPSDQNQILSVKDPFITTTATTTRTDNNKYLPIGTTTVIDSVAYHNLMPGQTYILKGELYDFATISTADPPVSTAIDNFPAASTSGTVTIDSFSTFDSTLHYDYTLGNNQKKFVVYQTLYFGDIELYSHAVPDDADQTVQLAPPKIHTNATYKFDDGKLLGVGDVTMKDYIDYEGLVEGEWYTVVGSMIDPETGETVEIEDEFVENSKTFKADAKGKGTVALEINLNTVPLQGRSFVVHERLYRSQSKHGDGRLLDEHLEALDEGDQTITVKVASIGTVAKDAQQNPDGSYDDVIDHEDGQTIIDTVHYDGLLMDEEYTLYGYLWDKTNNRPLLDKDGKRIEAYATFTTPTKKDNGDIEMTFPVDAHDLPGVEIVVYEYLFAGSEDDVPLDDDGYPDTDEVVTKHEDPEDEDQTVRVSMRVGTEAVDAYDNDHKIGVGYTQIIDHLKYEGVTIGKTYVAKGWLVYKNDGDGHHAGDRVQGARITCEDVPINTNDDETDDDDEEEPETEQVCTRTHFDIEGATTFVAGSDGYEETTGSVLVKLTEFDSRELIGEELVVYEELYLVNNDREDLVAEHKDLEDKDQLITVDKPEIYTIATDKADGDHELAKNGEVTITDKVSYKGLVPGTTYVLHGELMDKNSGNRLAASGVTEITWEFTPTGESGTENLEFTLTADDINGKAIVVFEELYILPTDQEDGEKIAEHKDLGDEDQTVWIGPARPNTGFFTSLFGGATQSNVVIFIVGGIALSLGGYAFVRRKTHVRRGEINFE